MSKLRLCGLVAAMLALGAGADAAPLGPYAGACRAGSDRPALLVRVIGLKARTGTIRVQDYGGDPDRYFDKGTWLKRVDIAVPAAGPIEICLPAAQPGTYAVYVRHDVDGSGKMGMSDGAGMSGNPRVTLFDVLFRRKPDPARVSVKVGDGVVPVPVVLNYVEGGSVRPVGGQG